MISRISWTISRLSLMHVWICLEQIPPFAKVSALPIVLHGCGMCEKESIRRKTYDKIKIGAQGTIVPDYGLMLVNLIHL